MTARIDVPLRWGDLDAQGHVNNARFIDYLQEARADYLVESPIATVLRRSVVVDQQIEYRSPVAFSTTPLAVDVSVAAVSAARFTLAYALYQADPGGSDGQPGRLCAVARTTLCPYDFAEGRPRRVDADARAWLAERVEPAEPFRPLTPVAPDDHARRTPLRVRWSDLDANGHVNNAVFFDYVQEGRVAFTAAAAVEMNDAVDDGYLWFVVRQDVDYLAPVLFRREPYVVRTGVASMGTTSLTFCSDVADDEGKRYAAATTVAVFANGNGRPIPVPQAWKDALTAYQVTTGV